MTAQHTPGPWTTTKLGSFRFVVNGRDELTADTQPVATVDSMACATDSTAYRWCVANTRLIAAAPTMLAALKQFEKIARCWSDGSAHAQHAAACEAIQWGAQTAIALAEGTE